jgi:amino acid transporter
MAYRTGFPVWYVVFLGVGALAYDFNGYDTSGRLSEETSSDEFDELTLASARGIVNTVIASGFLGMLVIIALVFATTNIPDALSGSTTMNSGNAAVNIIVAACGVDVAASVAWSFLFVVFMSGVSSTIGTSRICFALARDKMLPFSDYLAEIDDYMECPINAVIFISIFSILICLIALTPVDKNAFYCLIGISTVSFISSLTLDILHSLVISLVNLILFRVLRPWLTQPHC